MRVASLVSSSTPDVERPTSLGRASHSSFPRGRESTPADRMGADSCVGPRLRGDDIAHLYWRALLVAFAILLFASALSPTRAAETIAAIEVSGNRTVGSGCGALASVAATGSPYDASQGRPVHQGAVRHGPVCQRGHRAARRDALSSRSSRTRSWRASTSRAARPSTRPSSRSRSTSSPAPAIRPPRGTRTRCACATTTAAWVGLPPRSSRASSISPTAAWRWPTSSRRARSPRSTASPSSATARSPRASCATSSPPASRAGSTSSRARPSTTPSASTRTRSCCAATISSRASPMRAWSRPRPSRTRKAPATPSPSPSRKASASLSRRRPSRPACAAPTPAHCRPWWPSSRAAPTARRRSRNRSRR